MIHVNVRGLLVRKWKGEIQLIVQMRKRAGEPELYELPGGRIEEYEKMIDCLKREIMEETGLKVVVVQNEEDSIITENNQPQEAFSVECIKPFAAYQTIKGPVDSFGIFFICKVEGEPSPRGDDTEDVHWANMEEVHKMIEEHVFSEIDLPAVLMFLKERNL